jgi:hypothetical protein
MMCCHDDDECHGDAHESHHSGCCGGHGGHQGNCHDHGFPLMSIEEEIEGLKEMKGVLEKRLEIVNKRLEILRR